MVKLKYSLTLLLVIVPSLALLIAGPGKKIQTKQITKTVDVRPGALLDIHNKYGSIEVNTWEKEQIKFDITVTVKSTNEKKAKLFLNETDIEWGVSSNRIMAHTKYPNYDKNNWMATWSNDCKNIEYSVSYVVYTPENIDLEIQNKYGNITCNTPIIGNAFIANTYGDISTEDIDGNVTIQLESGKAYIGSTKDVTLNLSKGKIKLDNSDNVIITSKYSNIKIVECNTLNAKTKYDNLFVGSANIVDNVGKYDDWQIQYVDEVKLNAKFTDFVIDRLESSAEFKTIKGKVIVKSIGESLSLIDIGSKETFYELILEKDFHVDFEGKLTSFYIDEPFEKYYYDKKGDTKYVKLYRINKWSDTKVIALMEKGELVID